MGGVNNEDGIGSVRNRSIGNGFLVSNSRYNRSGVVCFKIHVSEVRAVCMNKNDVNTLYPRGAYKLYKYPRVIFVQVKGMLGSIIWNPNPEIFLTLEGGKVGVAVITWGMGVPN